MKILNVTWHSLRAYFGAALVYRKCLLRRSFIFFSISLINLYYYLRYYFRHPQEELVHGSARRGSPRRSAPPSSPSSMQPSINALICSAINARLQ
jgi:hypothetical protein